MNLRPIKKSALIVLASTLALHLSAAQQVFVGYEDATPYVLPTVQKPAPAHAPKPAPQQVQKPVVQAPANPVATPAIQVATQKPVEPAAQATSTQTEAAPTKSKLQKIKEFFRLGGSSDAPATVNPEAWVEKSKVQKTVNISGALLRGALRGFVTGLSNILTNSNGKATKKFGNLDAFIDMALDNNQIRTLSELIAGKVDDTNQAVITEEVTAALLHALIPFLYADFESSAKDRSGNRYETELSLPDFCVAFTSRLLQKLPALDTRTAEGVKKYTLLAARFVVESINLNAFAFRSEIASNWATQLPRWFNPMVGLTAVGRTLLVDWIITKREAAGTLTDAQSIRQTRTMLTGFFSLLNIPAKWFDDRYLSFLDCKFLGGKNTHKR